MAGPPPPLNLDNFSSFLRKRNNRNNNNGPHPCEVQWDNGVGYARDNFDKEFISVRNEHQCTVQFGDKFLFIDLKDLRRDEFIENIPLIYEKPTDDGYYTWLIYTEDTKQLFVATKALSILEIGTIHMDIAKRVNAKKIHAAGELKVDGESITFNLQSGTYMKPAMQKKGNRCRTDYFEELVIKKVKMYLGENAKDTEEPLINKDNLPITGEELTLYESYGALITQYDSFDKCKAANQRKNGGSTRKKRRSKRKTNKRTRR
jgi:hypothetical protein